MKKFSNIREKIKARYFTADGLDFGLTIGFIVSGVAKWFDIVLLKKSPEIILAVELYAVRQDTVVRPLLGRYPALEISKWVAYAEAPTRRSPCLIDYLMGNQESSPDYVFFPRKTSVLQDPDHGWVTAYGSTCDVECLWYPEEKSSHPLCSASLDEPVPVGKKRSKSKAMESEKALLRGCIRSFNPSYMKVLR